ncbi:hypothetical protein QA644_10735 [Rhizobium sp. CC1099]|uniref:hypothetical protein n=1 Tax=Rhizobium sp. CC1099 TaxID=3039160 RepID=UPI0024B23C52|nr:hypothetical protein [Rhizobium sp. CC1099]WFU89471.1 hypothetical protein QA644_10735 [Rhizobium sp. CC1099]
MLVKTVSTVLTTNSAGQVVESIPVREVEDGETDIIGHPVDVIEVEESDFGVPVRFVTEKAVQNSIGDWVDTIPVKGGGVPAGYTILVARNAATGNYEPVRALNPATGNYEIVATRIAT